jgi:hypothetical protein
MKRFVSNWWLMLELCFSILLAYCNSPMEAFRDLDFCHAANLDFFDVRQQGTFRLHPFLKTFYQRKLSQLPSSWPNIDCLDHLYWSILDIALQARKKYDARECEIGEQCIKSPCSSH